MAGFTIDMTIAKDVHRNNIRIARKEKLEALDIEFNRALEEFKGLSTEVDAPRTAQLGRMAKAKDQRFDDFYKDYNKISIIKLVNKFHIITIK